MTFSSPLANCRRIEITVGLPSDGWKFEPAMRGYPSADNELATGFPRPFILYPIRKHLVLCAVLAPQKVIIVVGSLCRLSHPVISNWDHKDCQFKFQNRS